MSHLLSVAQGWMSIGVKVGVVVWLMMARSGYGKFLSWLSTHTTSAERSVLKQLGTEAVHFAKMEFSDLPKEAQLERAVHYVTSAAHALGMKTNESQIRAVVAWGINELAAASKLTLAAPGTNSLLEPKSAQSAQSADD